MDSLKVVPLETATEEQKKAFLEMLTEQKADEELRRKGHTCWMFVPTETEYERMKRFSQPPNYDKCPKCGKGRIVIEIYNGNMGQGLSLKCHFNKEGCDFNEYISDD